MSVINCNCCDLVFDSESKYYAHYVATHKSTSPSIKKILILGGGFGGINVLNKIEKKFQNESIEITIVSDENFFLFTPMLPQVASGLLHPSNITIPVRYFCKKAKFLHASIDSIDLEQQLVTIQRSFDNKVRTLEYDYLVLALGGQTNFFNNENLEKHSFTMKTIADAIAIKNHLIVMLEHAAQTGNYELQRTLLTFVVVGAGFAGVETVSEINQFIKNSISKSYPTINPKNVNVILVSAKDRILPEVDEKLSEKATEFIEKDGVMILKNTKAIDADEENVHLSNGGKLSCATLIWTGGTKMDRVISELKCEHGLGGRVIVDGSLRMKNKENVFVLGDCALIKDDSLNSYYPSTAQHAIREGKTVAENLLLSFKKQNKLKKFTFHSLGIMAIIGERVGIATIAGKNISGLSAWLIWRTYYLSKIPTFGKKLKICVDWFTDSILARDVTLVGSIKKKEIHSIHVNENMPSIKEQLISDI
ncbi:6-phosphogluconate dehydrogenase [Nitrosopumilus sp. b3]|uniref:NAD(P)/FAD-dependent oxidoreductase n=1 Tax=Nitrosopumilus sp. b3 TaxID=2109909 RepID=UPI0015F42093|nr:NAD(P)/FAD-dependent oxidoreductase [Nitrosopumilus sp. b3]KAF6247067.1 6-phosphogluconate dehydrogenase [Nitrosopumilus sp. b3]